MTPAETEAARLLSASLADLAPHFEPAAFRALAEYRSVLRQLLSERAWSAPKPASWVTPDGSAWLTHEDLLTALGALRVAAGTASPEAAVSYRALSFRLNDDR
jgi:hypothetical protein